MCRIFRREIFHQLNQKGQLLIEVLIVIGLMSVLLISGLEILGPSLRISAQSRENEIVSSLIQEQFEVVRSIRNEDWNALFPIVLSETYHYEDIEGEEQGLRLVGDSVNFGKYLVSIMLDDVYRDVNGNVIETGDPSQLDDQTRKITVQVDWESYGTAKNAVQSIYLTNWGAF